MGGVAGLRVLVVEDEALVALEIEETLQALGCSVVGPAPTLQTALALASGETLDAAILDINIRGGKSYPVAEVLLTRGIPFILASGYAAWTLPAHLDGLPLLMKPFTPDQLKHKITSLIPRGDA